MLDRWTLKTLVMLLAAARLLGATPAIAQFSGPTGEVDVGRALELYVSDRPEDHDPFHNHELDVIDKLRTDSVYAGYAPGTYQYQKISYRSSVGDLDVPAYLFQPLDDGDPKSRPALVWVHGGVHGNFGAGFLPFVKDATRRGYVVIAPDYRGSTGYGAVFHDAIDYGGYEVDDVVTAYDYLTANVPSVDPDRVAVMGWSHGGFIASHIAFREKHPFRAAVAVVPVSNLILRLAYKGPAYQSLFSTQSRIRGLPHEHQDLYRERSPIYHVDNLAVPMLVQVASNDADVEFIEGEMFVNALRAKKPHLAETYIYYDPPGGHSFCCLVDQTFRTMNTPAMLDAWAKAWEFLSRQIGPETE